MPYTELEDIIPSRREDFQQQILPDLTVLGRALKKRRMRRRKGLRGAPPKAATSTAALSPVVQKKLEVASKKPGFKSKFLRLLSKVGNGPKRIALLAWAKKNRIKRTAKTLVKSIAKNPEVKRQLVTYMLRRRLAGARGVAATSPNTSNSSLPQGALQASPNPSASPTQAPVEYDHTPTPGETEEQADSDQALDRAEAEDTVDQQAVNDGEADAQADNDEAEEASAEDADEEMTEPDNGDTKEEAEEEAASDASSGESILGRIKRKKRKKAKSKLVHKVALPFAKQAERKSKGKYKATETMKGVALIQSAKAGNPKAKAAILKVQAKAKKGDPKATKTVKHLKVSHAVLKASQKKLGHVMTKPKRSFTTHYPMRLSLVKPMPLPKGGGAYQRGLAMIPGVAASHFRRIGKQA